MRAPAVALIRCYELERICRRILHYKINYINLFNGQTDETDFILIYRDDTHARVRRFMRGDHRRYDSARKGLRLPPRKNKISRDISRGRNYGRSANVNRWLRDPRNKESLAVTTTGNDEEKRVKSREKEWRKKRDRPRKQGRKELRGGNRFVFADKRS